MPKTIQLMVTCLVDSLFPEVGEAVVETLARAGVRALFPPEQTCCGQPAFNAGFRDEARRMARHTIEVFEKTEGAVVIPSGSCAAMLKHGYLELFDGDLVWLPRARALSERTYEFSQYLVDELGAADFGAVYEGRIAYHPSCHLLRGLGVERQPMALLESVQGAQVERLPAECCGFGGVFSIDQPEISAEMLSRKLGHVAASEADAVVACDVSCLMQMEGGLRKLGSEVGCSHLAQVLAGKELGLR